MALAIALGACTLLEPLDDLSSGASDGAAPPVDGGLDAPLADVVGADHPDAAAPVDGAGPADTGVDAPDVGADAPPSVTYPQVVLADNPIGYWRFGEPSGATAKDSSSAKHDGLYAGNVTLGTKGAIANDTDTAASFDGTNAYVLLGNFYQFPNTSPFSVEAWVKPNVDGSYHGILSRNDANGPPSQGYILYVEPTPAPVVSLDRIQSTASYAVVQSSTNAGPGAWSHVVATYDGSTLAIYFDGAIQQTQPAAFAITGATNPFVIAAEAGGSDSYYSGAIDEVAVYDHALTDVRVLAHYHVGIGQPP